MAQPNIRDMTTLTADTATLAVTTSATAILSNGSSSGDVYKVRSLYVSNVDGTNDADVTVDHYRSSTARHIAYEVTVPAKASVVVISELAPVYLEEDDSLRLTASANSDLEAVCSYDILTDD